MFEDSVLIQGQRRSGAWFAALGLQVVVLGGVLAIPLLRPESLPVVFAALPKATLMMTRPEVKPEIKPRIIPTMKPTSGISAPTPTNAATASVTTLRTPGLISRTSALDPSAPTLASFGPSGMGSPNGIASAIDTPTTSASVTAKSIGPVRISSGVSAGMLIGQIRPVYPRVAVAAHIAGEVIVTATIDRDGRVIGARALSGPVMLQGAAIEAVQAARYRPFLLNGQAVEVATTITVHFSLGA